MSSINLIDGNLDDIAAIRLIYTQQKEHEDGDTIAIHLKPADLQDIIDEINKIQQDNPDKTGSGVRFYISKYPKNYPTQDGCDYSKMHSVVAIPTYNINGDKKTHYDNIDGNHVKNLKRDIDNGVPDPLPGAGYDHYELCPPNTGCANGMIIWNNIQ
jgi:hypothetical protein